MNTALKWQPLLIAVIGLEEMIEIKKGLTEIKMVAFLTVDSYLL